MADQTNTLIFTELAPRNVQPLAIKFFRTTTPAFGKACIALVKIQVALAIERTDLAKIANGFAGICPGAAKVALLGMNNAQQIIVKRPTTWPLKVDIGSRLKQSAIAGFVYLQARIDGNVGINLAEIVPQNT